MSLELAYIHHSMKTRRGQRRIELKNVNLRVDEGERVALMGKRGSGLEELLNIICGAVYPARGSVMRTSEISWPIGDTSFLSSEATLATNLRFVARIYEADQNEYAARVGDVAQVHEHWNVKFGGCARDVKARFAFGLGVCLPFDIYLFGSREVADRGYRERADAIVDELGHSAGIIVATSRGSVAQQFCDRGFVLDEGTVTYYEDIEAAVAHLEQLTDAEPVEADELPDDREEEDTFDVI